MPSARHNHFTSYNRRRILNDVPLIKKIEDPLPLEVTLVGENVNNTERENPCCTLAHRRAESREKDLLEEIERLKNKLKTKSARHKTKWQEQKQQHDAELQAKDREIERLKAAASKPKREDTNRPTRRKTSRRRSWSDRSSQNDSSSRGKSNNSLRSGLRSSFSFTRQRSQKSVSVPRSFAAGGQKPSRRDIS